MHKTDDVNGLKGENMRNLTIKRTKCFVGCLTPLKVYIEDQASDEIVIGGTPCRKLGTVKNGEEKTFEIEERALKVFVIADKLSKNYCNDFYQLPEGQAPISLSGRPHFNLFTGNSFRFDNNDNKAAIKNRKRSLRKGLIIFVAFFVICAVAGYFGVAIYKKGSAKAERKEFSSNGMSITLTKEFKEIEYAGFIAAYNSPNVAVAALREAFYTLAPRFDNTTEYQYAKMVLQNNGATALIKTTDDMVNFEYDKINPSTQTSYHYIAYVYRASDAFWLVQFVTVGDKAADYAESIRSWAKSVKFSD